MCQLLGKTTNFSFFVPNLSKNEFWSQNYKNVSPDMESALLIYQAYQFLDKMVNFGFFSLNFGEFPKYVQYFGSFNIDGVAKS